MEKINRFIHNAFPRRLPVLLLLIAAIISMLMSKWAGCILGEIQVNYESDNMPTAAGMQESGSQQAPAYRYYLDISPSMIGYLASEGRMVAVGQALRTLSQDRGGDVLYYTCAEKVKQVGEGEFFDYLEDTQAMVKYYSEILMQESLAATVQEINPCRIFTDEYSNGQYFDSEGGMVNVIVTDLNFLKDPDDLDGHKSLMDDFAEHLSTCVKDCNFSIYRIRSTHIGPPTDEYNPNDERTANREDSFFIIVLAQNDRIYRQYIGNFEDVFGRQEISLADSHQLLNDPVGENRTISLDRDSEFFRSSTQRTGLHWDNLSFRDLPDNAVAFHMVYTGDEPWASLQLPVAKLSLPGYGDAEDNATSAGRVTTNIKKYQNALFGGWREDPHFSGLTGNTAYIRGYDSDWYLWFSMDLEKRAPTSDQFGDSLKLHHCVLLDVRFQLDTIDYPVPAWVNNIDTDTLPTDSSYSEKIGIAGLIQALNRAQAETYSSKANSSQGYLGNLLILIDY